MAALDEARRCVLKWVATRPVLEGWLRCHTDFMSDSMIIEAGVPTRFTATDGKTLYYWQRTSVAWEMLDHLGTDIPAFVDHTMRRMVTELVLSTIQPDINQVSLVPRPPKAHEEVT